MEQIISLLTYPFARRALLVGILISLCAALLGVNLVLRRFSMLGDGLSHVAFGAAAIALAAGVAPLQVSIPVVIIASFLLLRINERGRIRGDAAIALLSSSALAVGIIVASLTTGMNTDINNYMFGSILTVSRGDTVLAIVVAALVLAVSVLFYNKIFASVFEENFAAATGVPVRLCHSLFAILTAVTVVIGMRMMGALLISSIITFPALTSMRVCRSYRGVTVSSAVVAVAALLGGLALSFGYDIPAGASVVAVNLILFLAFSLIAVLRDRRPKGRKTR